MRYEQDIKYVKVIGRIELIMQAVFHVQFVLFNI